MCSTGASPSQFPIFPHFLNLSPQISPSLSIFPHKYPHLSPPLRLRTYIYNIAAAMFSDFWNPDKQYVSEGQKKNG